MNIEAQLAAILAGRSGPLGRAILCEVFAHETGTRLADAIRTTTGLVAVVYTDAPDRVTGDIAAVVDLADPDAELDLAAPYSPLPGRRLTEAITAGRTKITVSTDADAWLDRRLAGHRAGASPVERLAALRARLRTILRHKQTHDFPAPSIRATEIRLEAAQADLDQALAQAEARRRRRRGRPHR